MAEIMDISSEPFDINYGVNNELAAQSMTQHLIDKGRRNIAFCSLYLDWRAILRKQGWATALDNAELSAERYVSSRADATFQAGAELLSETLHKWPDTDALFFVSDELAAGAVMECNRRGIKPGKDIDICGFNDLSFARSIYPALTTVSVPRRKMAKWRETLISLIEGEDVEQATKFYPLSLKYEKPLSRRLAAFAPRQCSQTCVS